MKDLVPYIGRANRVYEMLNGKRSLTLDMIRTCIGTWGFPPKA